MTLAGHFAKSGYFKDATDHAKAIVKIMAGRELGIGPMQAMTGIHIVQGRPALSAGLIAALVLRSGRYTYTVAEQSETTCRLVWQRDGSDIGESSFTIEEAKRASLTGKEVWKAYPSDLLFARALTRGVRRYCADVTLGDAYTPEELGHIEGAGRPRAASSDINARLSGGDDEVIEGTVVAVADVGGPVDDGAPEPAADTQPEPLPAGVPTDAPPEEAPDPAKHIKPLCLAAIAAQDKAEILGIRQRVALIERGFHREGAERWLALAVVMLAVDNMTKAGRRAARGKIEALPDDAEHKSEALDILAGMEEEPS